MKLKLLGVLALICVVSVGVFANPFGTGSAGLFGTATDDILTDVGTIGPVLLDFITGITPWLFGVFAIMMGLRLARSLIKAFARG